MACPLARRRPSHISGNADLGGSITHACSQNKPRNGHPGRPTDKGCPGFASGPAEGLSGGPLNDRNGMSAAEQLEDARGKQSAPRDALMEAEAVLEAPLAATPARRPK